MEIADLPNISAVPNLMILVVTADNADVKNVLNSLTLSNFFYGRSNQEEWNYICNFLHDLFRVNWITRINFRDISEPIIFPINKTAFTVSSSDQNSFLRLKKDGCMYYMLGNRKYRFYPKIV